MTGPGVVVLDYGSGNLRSAQRALECAGARVTVTSDARAAGTAAGLFVPGVGAFAACMLGLLAVGGDDVVRARAAAGRPTLGVCVGMQVLFDRGVEHGVVSAGVGLFPGEVTRLHAPVVPHMGWTEVATPPRSPLFGAVAGERFYFVHSYAARRAPGAVTYAEHGERFVAAVEHDAVVATQFHPEKSGPAGLALLRNWVGSLS